MAKKKNHEATGKEIIMMWIAIFIGSSIAVYLANKFAPGKVVLGTEFITPFWAILHSMGTLAVIDVAMVPVIETWANNKGKLLTDKDWMMEYFLINTAALWVISRFAENMGLGLSSWVVVVVLAFVVNAAQGIAMMPFMSKK